MKKRFIVRLFIHEGNVYQHSDFQKACGNELESVVRRMSDLNLDEIMVVMDGTTEEEKLRQFTILKDICSFSEIPVSCYAKFTVFDDIKKAFYSKAGKVIINVSGEGANLVGTAKDRFGKEKIAVTKDLLEDLISFTENYKDHASEAYCFEKVSIPDECDKPALPLVVMLDNVFLDKLMETLSTGIFTGVFGNVIDGSINEINSIKALCLEKDIDVSAFTANIKWEELKLNSDGLIPVIAQDYITNEVLMMAYMNEEAFNTTIKTGKMNYYSRSRQSQWEKGETSGHFQYVKEMYADCDLDTILVKISQIGAACHTGNRSCFFNEICSKEYNVKNPKAVLEDVYNVILDRKANPKEGSYTNYLFDKGLDKILKKVGEEATEIVIASKNPDNTEVKYEISDFLYHCMVLMAEKGITWDDICDELADR